VAGDEVRVALPGRGFGLPYLARAEVGVRMRMCAALHELAGDRYACRSQQLAELRDVIAVAQRAHAKRALARPPRALRLALSPLGAARCGRQRTAAIAASLHPAPSLVLS